MAFLQHFACRSSRLPSGQTAPDHVAKMMVSGLNACAIGLCKPPQMQNTVVRSTRTRGESWPSPSSVHTCIRCCRGHDVLAHPSSHCHVGRQTQPQPYCIIYGAWTSSKIIAVTRTQSVRLLLWLQLQFLRCMVTASTDSSQWSRTPTRGALDHSLIRKATTPRMCTSQVRSCQHATLPGAHAAPHMLRIEQARPHQSICSSIVTGKLPGDT
jgi:hypothetical protein